MKPTLTPGEFKTLKDFVELQLKVVGKEPCTFSQNLGWKKLVDYPLIAVNTDKRRVVDPRVLVYEKADGGTFYALEANVWVEVEVYKPPKKGKGGKK